MAHRTPTIRLLLITVMIALLAACNAPAPTSEPTAVVMITSTPFPTDPNVVTLTPAGEATATGELPMTELPSEVPFPTDTPTDAGTLPTDIPAATATASEVPAMTSTVTTLPTVAPAASETPTITATINLTPSKTPIVENNAFALGAHVFGFGHFDKMRQAGMTWLKLQIRWDGSSPASAVQSQLTSARNGGFKVLLSVVGDLNQLGADRAGYITRFATYVAGIAALGPDAIEVWNEPNIDREWPRGQISGGNYAQMLIESYNAIKAANPAVMVISGAPAPTGYFGGRCAAEGCDDNIFITQMQQAGAANAMDCVGMHYNDGIVPPDRTSGDPRGSSDHYSRYFKTLIALYAGVFPGKPVCFTELGYLTSQGYGALPAGFEWAANTTIQNQAEWQAGAARIAKAGTQVRLIIVWNLDAVRYDSDPMAGYAIIRKDGSCIACAALGAVMSSS
ncbi:MAG: hypothetical protein LCI00_13345 [Chloroflexi bacterium]|nr:hypothetical protein [Chloroflexota bacterium]